MADDVPFEWNPISVSFPQARVKKVMKADKDVGSIQQDALLRVACAAEVFLDFLTDEVSKISDKEKRKTIAYKDVATTISVDNRFTFLAEVVPKPLPLAEALEYQRKKKAEFGEAVPDVHMEEGDEEETNNDHSSRTHCQIQEEQDPMMQVANEDDHNDHMTVD